MAILNREKIYYCYIDKADNTIIRVAISRLIYGRSCMPVVDFVQDSSDSWYINIGKHLLRAQDCRYRHTLGDIFSAEKPNIYYYNGFRGPLDECIEHVYRMEKDSKDPYACMRQDWDGRQRYDDAIKTGIELEIKQGGLSINDYFCI